MKNLKAVADVLVSLPSLSFPVNAAPFATKAQIALEKAGFYRHKTIADSLISGHAMSRGYILVTDNERHFKPIPGLFRENRRPAT